MLAVILVKIYLFICFLSETQSLKKKVNPKVIHLKKFKQIHIHKELQVLIRHSSPNTITAHIISRRKSLTVDSLTENGTSSPVSKGSYKKTVTENTQQLISEVGKTQKEEKK